MTQARRQYVVWLLVYGIHLLGGFDSVYPDEPFDQNRIFETLSYDKQATELSDHQALKAEIPHDTQLDSTQLKFKQQLNAHYERKPVHPRFRDEYRILQDIRRLFRMVDRRSVNGYEPMDRLAAIGQNMPSQKQRMVIGAAAIGGIASVAAGFTNRQLRKQKINYFYWNVERIYARYHAKGVRLQLYSGLLDRGFYISVPKYRLSYSRDMDHHAMGENITYFPHKHVGVQVGYYNKRQLITPILRHRYGVAMFRYDRDLHILITRLESRYYSHFILRLLHVKRYDRPNADYWRSELILYW